MTIRVGGTFEKAHKRTIYWNNVNEEGKIIGEEQIPEADKIKLPNDGILNTLTQKQINLEDQLFTPVISCMYSFRI